MKNSMYREIGACTLLSPTAVTLVSCRGTEPQAEANALAVAWCGVVNSHPPMVSVSIQPVRHSFRLIEESGEFAVNLVGEDQCRQMDWCGVNSAAQVPNKLEKCGLKTRPASGLKIAPGIEGSPAILSCRVRHRLELGSHVMYIGEVVAVEVREDLFDPDGSMHLERAGLVCYNHGVYQRAGDVLGFFGYSVAREDVLKRRMAAFSRAEEGEA